MICCVCAIGLHYVILKFLSVNLFLWGHELANSFLLFSVHKSFLQIYIFSFLQIYIFSIYTFYSFCLFHGVRVA